MLLSKRFTFEAAHRLPYVAKDHKCSRVHGHSYEVIITVKGPVNPLLGMVVDFGDLKEVCEPEVKALDHRFLNDVPGLFNPTAENIAVYLWDRLIRLLRDLHNVTVVDLHSVRVQETRDSWVEYLGD